ncbi:MAG: recombinase family protein [Erythrobacter sp.]
MTRKTIRCAIYTRKSSEEGLEQEFNSLDAQREAGEAYVKSQAHEGWKAIPTLYDDGGFSGGSMERPALQKLLSHVDAGLIDVVVVYKIDRLTRSLPDFARIVERFDAQEVSFVSVTQAFNTTSSMGRLTLNVLLSFAQFEREVTGERIRDKIAASKAKGKWIGGNMPLGYDRPKEGTHTLIVNDAEAQTVRHIFNRYLELKSVHALERELKEDGILSKSWTTLKSKPMGGLPFSRGALFYLLRNPVYLGMIRHKQEVHEGEHRAILEQELFDKVQTQLDAQARRHRASPKRRVARSPLTGKLFDANGEPMTPSFSRGSRGKHYRYYVSASLQQGGKPTVGIAQRIPAEEIEALAKEFAGRVSNAKKRALNEVLAVHLQSHQLQIDLSSDTMNAASPRLESGETILFENKKVTRFAVAISLPKRGGQSTILPSQTRKPRIDKTLVASLRKAHQMLKTKNGMPLVEQAPASPHEGKILRMAFLAPDIQSDIMKGLQPHSLNLQKLKQMHIPLCWDAQRKALGWIEMAAPCSSKPNPC